MGKSVTKHKSQMVLLLIDVINHFEFEDGPALLRSALKIGNHLARVKRRAKEVGVPAIYVNDNFGKWQSDMPSLLAYCLRSEAPGRSFVDQVRPDPEDYFVLKPMHSAFYQTPLDLLLRHLEATSVVITGLATNSCVLCTAHDARMRDLRIFIPTDCCTARTRREHDQAISHIARMADANVMLSSQLRFHT